MSLLLNISMKNKMNFRIYLQIAAGLFFFIGVFHIFIVFFGFNSANADEENIIGVMRSYYFDTPGGIQRSMMNLMDSYNYSFAVFNSLLGFITIFLLRMQLQPAAYRQLIIINIAAWVIMVIILSATSVLPAVISYGLILLCFIASYINLKKNNETGKQVKN